MRSVLRGHACGPRRGGLRCGWPWSGGCPGSSRPYVVQAGSACPRVGRPAPTAFNRAGEKVPGDRGGLPRVQAGVVSPPTQLGLALPVRGEMVLGAGQPGALRWIMRRSGGLRGQVVAGDAAAGGGGGVPAGAVDGHGVDPAQQRGGARDPGLGRAARGPRGRLRWPAVTRSAGRGGRAAASAAWVMAWYFAAITGLWSSSGRPRARRPAAARAGRGGRCGMRPRTRRRRYRPGTARRA